MKIKIDQFFISKHNPRTKKEIESDPDTQALADSMKAIGQLNSLIVREVDGKYEIGAGTRR